MEMSRDAGSIPAASTLKATCDSSQVAFFIGFTMSHVLPKTPQIGPLRPRNVYFQWSKCLLSPLRDPPSRAIIPPRGQEFPFHGITMTTYEKRLKRGKDGLIVRYVGKNQKGVKEKFRLGYDLAEAGRRVGLIQALWAEMENKCCVNEEVVNRERTPYWESEYLDAAKSIAKGGQPTLPKNGCYEEPESYLHRLSKITAIVGTKFEPANPADLTTAISLVQEEIRESRNKLSLALNVPISVIVVYTSSFICLLADVGGNFDVQPLGQSLDVLG
jgi:hypothetical protein